MWGDERGPRRAPEGLEEGTRLGPSKATRDAEFTTFVEAAGPRLLRTAIALTGTREGGQELVQASLVKAYAAWPRIRRAEAYAYTRRIMVHERVDRWRATRHEVVSETVPEASHAPPTTTEDRDGLVRLLAALPAQQRKVVVLRYYSDLSEQAVAELLGISVGAVKSAASRGLATLRSRAGADDPTQAGAR